MDGSSGGSNTTKPIENYAAEEARQEKEAADYDYESFAKSTQTTKMKRTRKPKKAKSKRPTLLQWLAELVASGQKQEREKTTLTKAFGANSLQLFGEQQTALTNDRPRPMSTSSTSFIDVDVPAKTPILFAYNAQAALAPQTHEKLSEERKRLNEGCKSWSDFHRITSSAQLSNTRRPNLIEGQVKKEGFCQAKFLP